MGSLLVLDVWGPRAARRKLFVPVELQQIPLASNWVCPWNARP